jgi:K+-sensing histidine kinase KdpD
MKTKSLTVAQKSGRQKVASARRELPSLTRTRILVPIDFSAESTRALKHATVLAKQSGAAVTLLHVVFVISATVRSHAKSQTTRS